ncbi:hypothetical protein L1887_36210 [Cichorium endivia]|nr:hypothetical protein L1887_36210 [Cichorium endivia]
MAQNLITLLVVLNFAFLINARPLNILNTINCPDKDDQLFDSFSLGSIKEGPSPGIGHKFEDRKTLGGIKVGSSPGLEDGYAPKRNKDEASHETRHVLMNIDTLGAVKDGPSPGIGHKVVNVETLGNLKNSGPSPGAGH